LTFFALAAAVSCQNQPLNNPLCGLSSHLVDKHKIVNGQRAVAGEHPWQVAMYRTATNAFFCGGSLISNEWVVSAAHCFSNPNPALYYTEIGSLDRVNKETWVQRLTFKVLVNHANYNPTLIRDDITVIKLSRPVIFTEQIRPICVPEQDGREDHGGKTGIVSGWGSGAIGGAANRYLMTSNENLILTDDRCVAKYGAFRIDLESQICHGDNRPVGAGPCQGDSGGPLSVMKVIDGVEKNFLVGIVSWAVGCGNGAVYVRPDYYMSWITSHMALYPN